MRRWVVLAACSAVLAAFVGLAAFTVGGLMGFLHGYNAGTYAATVTSAGLVVIAREAAEKGQADAAEGLVQTAIDGALISDWANHRLAGERPFYVPGRFHVDLTPMMLRIVRYRRAHPRLPPEGPGEAMVQEVLARYAPAAVAEEQGAIRGSAAAPPQANGVAQAPASGRQGRP